MPANLQLNLQLATLNLPERPCQGQGYFLSKPLTLGGTVSHLFGDRVTQHLSRRHGLSQNKLAEGVDQDPAVISAMCNGRRLTGRQARERVLAIIGWLVEQEVLDTRAEADALLEAAGMARLHPDRPAEARLLEALPQDRLPAVPPGLGLENLGMKAPTPPGRGLERVRGRQAIPPARGWMPWAAILVVVTVLGAIGLLVGLGLPVLRSAPSSSPAWQEDFDPLHVDRWQHEYASAAWEDLPGPGAVLREDHPRQNYGKAESAPIVVDVSRYPILRVSVTAVDPGASYTVQILDKTNNTSQEVLEELVYPGEHAIDLAQAMGWHGLQVFTINLWVGGESRSVTFERIGIEADGAR